MAFPFLQRVPWYACRLGSTSWSPLFQRIQKCQTEVLTICLFGLSVCVPLCFPGQCSLNLTDAEGYIEMPPSSDSFDSTMDCTYFVTVYLGYGVEIQVSHFSESAMCNVFFHPIHICFIWSTMTADPIQVSEAHLLAWVTPVCHALLQGQQVNNSRKFNTLRIHTTLLVHWTVNQWTLLYFKTALRAKEIQSHYFVVRVNTFELCDFWGEKKKKHRKICIAWKMF